jgi:6-phosphogluconate dehydrogenase
VFARCISAFKDERIEAAKVLSGPTSDSVAEQPAKEDRESLLNAVHDALYCAKICSYAQGFEPQIDA